MTTIKNRLKKLEQQRGVGAELIIIDCRNHASSDEAIAAWYAKHDRTLSDDDELILIVCE